MVRDQHRGGQCGRQQQETNASKLSDYFILNQNQLRLILVSYLLLMSTKMCLNALFGIWALRSVSRCCGQGSL